MGASRKVEPVQSEELLTQWAQEVERARALVHDLRNPIGAIALANELLQGPLAKVQNALDRNEARTLRTTLEALSCAVEQAVHLVQAEHALPRADLSLPSRPAPQDAANDPTAPLQAPPSAPAPKVTDAPVTGQARVDVVAMLRKLEILIVTRSALPALIAVQCPEPLWLEAQGAQLMRALSNLVENAIEASERAKPNKGPWTITLKCERLEDGSCHFLVRNEGEAPKPEVLDWLANQTPKPGDAPKSSKPDNNLHGVGLSSVRAILESLGGRLGASHQGGETVFEAWLPPSRVRLSAPA